MGDGIRRALICALVVAAIAAGVIVSRGTSDAVGIAHAISLPAAAGGSEVAAQDVSSSVWYCASAIPSTLVFSSRSSSAVSAVIKWAAQPGESTISVPAGGQADLPPQANASGPQGATVVLNGGGVAVSQLLKVPDGSSVSQCASSLSPHWYFPQGSTLPGNAVTLDIYDPAATPAVVDVDLITASGETQPAAYQGISVAPGELVSESLDAHATNDSEFATVVQAATGSVVAEELSFVSADASVGFTDQLGSPQPQRLWAFPFSEATPGGSLVLNVMNPGNSIAHVVVRASDGARVPFTPVTALVTGQSTSVIILSSAPGFTLSTPYAVTVSSNVGIVVARTIQDHSVGALNPTEGTTTGVPVGADRWIVPSVPGVSTPEVCRFRILGRSPSG